jgi:general stress protein YciG
MSNIVTGEETPKLNRGFRMMTKEKRKRIAKIGGQTAHERGTAYEWNSETAREAGRKGGLAASRNRKLAAAATA